MAHIVSNRTNVSFNIFGRFCVSNIQTEQLSHLSGFCSHSFEWYVCSVVVINLHRWGQTIMKEIRDTDHLLTLFVVFMQKL